MHMRASESYIYSLSFPVRGAWSMHGYLYLSLPAPSCMCPSKHTAQNPFFLCILMSFIHSYPPFFLLIFLSFFSPLKTLEENVYQDSSRRCLKLTPHFEPSAKAPKSQQMESLGCSSGSMRLSCGAPASPMHLAFCVKVPPSTLPSSSSPFKATLPSPPAIGTRWQQHCRRRTRQTLPQPARFDRGSVLGRRHQAAAAGSTPGRRHQAAAVGSTPGRRRWNTTANVAWVAVIEAAGRKVGSLDQLRRPSTMPLSPPLSPSSSPEVKKESMWLKGAQREVENGLGL